MKASSAHRAAPAGRQGLTRFEILCIVLILCGAGFVAAFYLVPRHGKEAAPRTTTADTRADRKAAKAGGGQAAAGGWNRASGGENTGGTAPSRAGRDGETALAAEREGDGSTPGSDGTAAARKADAADKKTAAGATASITSDAPDGGRRKTNPAADAPRTGAEVLAALRSAIDTGDLRRLQNDEAYRAMTVEDVQEGLRMVQEDMPWGPEADQLTRQLLTQWGALDPQAALAYTMQLEIRRTRDSAIGNILVNWARNDPSDAYRWYVGALGMETQYLGNNVQALYRVFASADPAWAFEQVWSLPDDNLRSTALRTIFGRMIDEGANNDMVALYNRLPEGREKSLAAAAIAQSWSPYQPEQAAQWISTISDEQVRQSAYAQLTSSWSANAPAEAADWVITLPEDNFRRSQISRVVQNWARDNPVAASQWLTEQHPPSSQLDPAVRTLAGAVSRTDPQGALSWAQMLTTPADRDRTIIAIGKNWLQRDPANASAYLATVPMSPAVQRKLFPPPPAAPAPQPR